MVIFFGKLRLSLIGRIVSHALGIGSFRFNVQFYTQAFKVLVSFSQAPGKLAHFGNRCAPTTMGDKPHGFSQQNEPVFVPGRIGNQRQ